jgi:hypothetical protein
MDELLVPVTERLRLSECDVSCKCATPHSCCLVDMYTLSTQLFVRAFLRFLCCSAGPEPTANYCALQLRCTFRIICYDAFMSLENFLRLSRKNVSPTSVNSGDLPANQSD